MAVLTAFLIAALSGCGSDDSAFTDELGRCAEFDKQRQVYWGDTHVHTELSFDANLQGTRTTQEDAYDFARGVTIDLQPYDEDGVATRTATIDRPLHFVMVSDHAEFLSTIALCNDSSSPAYGADQCVDYRAAKEATTPEGVFSTFALINALTAVQQENVRYPALCGPGDEDCLQSGMDVWSQIVESAEAAYDRSDSCQLTTFPGYEWSGGPETKNLHRNVMFKDGNVTALPYSYFDEPYPEGLWARLKEECLDADNGCDVLAIPHNSNLSDGIFFENKMANGQPFTTEYAQTSHAIEPVIEIYQHKGASECLPGGTAPDELCGFEVLPFPDLAATNLENVGEPDPKGFLRFAYGEGMKLEDSLGVNPFQYGITAATDTHISASGFVAENDFKGHGGAGQPNRFLPAPEGFPDIEYLSPGGLTAVWAEENAREAIFSAFRRKETFGTSGPRIKVRMFGGWDYPSDLCNAAELERAAQGYAGGVPMGGTLPPRSGSAAPKLVVHAMQDSMGAPLQRIQIVKGWLEGQEHRVEVYDVAGNPDNGASVDMRTCERRGEGFGDLCTVWEDPAFDPSQRAYYYARVIEVPTCRWTTWQCVRAVYDCNDPVRQIDLDCCDPVAGLNVDWCESVDCRDPESLPPADARCCDPRLEPTIQERAWTSPIWYQPAP
ncbi:MAG: hypothetical protein AMJ62_09790 [Myxococcales bacterium SG8_38]|nr:MAG: hypothetical protein AMJ62_09790 [Myxococcales bacterium SG8_38]